MQSLAVATHHPGRGIFLSLTSSEIPFQKRPGPPTEGQSVADAHQLRYFTFVYVYIRRFNIVHFMRLLHRPRRTSRLTCSAGQQPPWSPGFLCPRLGRSSSLQLVKAHFRASDKNRPRRRCWVAAAEAVPTLLEHVEVSGLSLGSPPLTMSLCNHLFENL